MVMRLLCWTLSVLWCMLDVSRAGPTPIFRLLTVIIMIAFVYQDLNSELHHRATDNKKAVNVLAISHLKSCRNVVRVKCVSDNGVRVECVSDNGVHVVSQTMGPALNVSQTMGSTLSVSQTMGSTIIMSQTMGPALNMSQTMGPALNVSQTMGSTIIMSQTMGPALNMSQTMGPALNMSQTMGNTQHIMDALNSSTVRDIWGIMRGLSHLVKLEEFWGEGGI